MLGFINEKRNCTGCTACYAICPINCIVMKEDEEGFLYPISDDSCINCNKCKDVCPIYNKRVERIPSIAQYSAAALTKNNYVWKESTSGGAFTEICNVFGDKNTVVFGAKFEGLKIVHSYVVGVENIGVFRKSKYVQSDLNECFNKAECFLKQGIKVLFSGTPCQIAGLRSYLVNDYDNLFCVDLICHGVGSQKVFGDSLENVSKKYDSKLQKYTFRYKKIIMGNYKEYVSNYIFANYKNKFIELDEYNQLFLSQLCLRKSCQSNCKFRTTNRMGDITIADFKNLAKVFPKVKNYKNYSTIVVNSQKGDIVYKRLSKTMQLMPCDLKVIKINNPLFCRTTYDNPLRDKFYEDYVAGMEIKDLLDKYIPAKNKRKFGRIKDFVPYNIKLALFKMFRK